MALAVLLPWFKPATTPVGHPFHTRSPRPPPQDMSTLTHLHEPGVLWNLSARYATQGIYTAVGSILIAVNPFAHVPGLFDQAVMDVYVQASTGS